MITVYHTSNINSSDLECVSSCNAASILETLSYSWWCTSSSLWWGHRRMPQHASILKAFKTHRRDFLLDLYVKYSRLHGFSPRPSCGYVNAVCEGVWNELVNETWSMRFGEVAVVILGSLGSSEWGGECGHHLSTFTGITPISHPHQTQIPGASQHDHNSNSGTVFFNLFFFNWFYILS